MPARGDPMHTFIAYLLVLTLALVTATPLRAQPAVTRTPVAFQIVNRNGSALPCASDGRPYVVRGELVTPTGTSTGSLTIALHEFSFGRFFWSLPGHPAYDVAEAMAREGHPWLILDRLGYDTSDHPVGTATCLGAQADVVAQIVRAVGRGEYSFGAASRGPVFPRVVLAGHSVGAGIAELVAHSFPELPIDGLAILAWADQSYSVDTMRQSLQQAEDCASGGEAAERDAPSGYAWFGRTPEQFRRNMFFDAEPAVQLAATARRNRDPCGDNASLVRLAAVNRLGVGEIEVPVLLLFGDRDPVFMTDAARRQAAAFRASSAVTLHMIPRAAHALTLERSGALARARLADWLGSIRSASGRRER